MPVLVGLTLWLPEVAWFPDQAPLAVQLSASVLDQLRLLLSPAVIALGVALRLTLGAVGMLTVTVAEAVALPPAPLQVRV